MSVENCKFAKEILHTRKMFRYLSRSQCGFEDKQAFICCTRDDPRDRDIRKNMQTPKQPTKTVVDTPWLGKLKRVFPGPQICGIQNEHLEDKIFGGEQTKIDEFPWIVPMFYSIREFNYENLYYQFNIFLNHQPLASEMHVEEVYCRHDMS